MVRLLDNRALHIAFIVLATGLCFWPGLDSLFLFDDGPNLDALVHIREASLSSPDFREFVLAGRPDQPAGPYHYSLSPCRPPPGRTIRQPSRR